jgi:hypothetical protein
LAVPVCRWGAEASGIDFVIWGDSHARALAPEAATLLSEGGRKGGISIGVPRCPPLAGVALVGRSDTSRCPAIGDAIFKTIAREKPKVVVLAARWADLASDVRAPGDGRTSGWLADLENHRARIELGDAMVRTIERMRAFGTRVVLVGPVPEIEFDVPTILVRSLNGFGRLPPTLRADFNVRQRQVLAAMHKARATGNVAVVYPHEALCDEATCAVVDGIQSLYEDDDHLSPFGSARVSALIGSALGMSGR